MILIVVYLSLTSEPVELDTGLPFQDKFFHALAYFGLMIWFVQIYHVRRQVNLWAIGFVLMGVVIEYIQSFDPARSGEFADMLANCTGVAIAYGLSATRIRNTLVWIERRLA